MEDIGSTTGIQSYVSRGTKGWCPGLCIDIIPVPLCLRDGGALRGSCRASPVCVCVCVWLQPLEGLPGDAPGMQPSVLGGVITH